MKVMFDTNVFSDIINKQIAITPLRGKVTIYATHVQRDELNATGDQHKAPNGKPLRQELVEYFHFLTEVKPTESYIVGVSRIGGAKVTRSVVSTESSVWDISDWGQGWGNNTNLFKEIFQRLEQKNTATNPKKKAKKRESNSKDALIAETAILNKYTLVTHDGPLLEVVKGLNCNVLSLEDLMQRVGQKEAATV